MTLNLLKVDSPKVVMAELFITFKSSRRRRVVGLDEWLAPRSRTPIPMSSSLAGVLCGTSDRLNGY